MAYQLGKNETKAMTVVMKLSNPELHGDIKTLANMLGKNIGELFLTSFEEHYQKQLEIIRDRREQIMQLGN
jgi:hypothetical protein